MVNESIISESNNVILESILKWDLQIKSIIKRCFYVINAIYKIKEKSTFQFSPIKTKSNGSIVKLKAHTVLQ